MSKDEADYVIDKALAIGVLDKDANLNFVAKGFTAEEIAADVVKVTTAWGGPLLSPPSGLRGKCTIGNALIFQYNAAPCGGPIIAEEIDL